MHKIQSIIGREVLDSRGNPTVEVELGLASGARGRAIVPSGASTGIYEALELRDGDNRRYLGKGVLKAIEKVERVIAKPLLGSSFSTLEEFDRKLVSLDPSAQKSDLGGNSVLGVSLAFAHALSHAEKKPLSEVFHDAYSQSHSKERIFPVPLMNIVNGGLHANNGLAIQEFMVAPFGFSSFKEALRAGVEVFHHLKKALGSSGHSTAVGDEGGFAPRLKSHEEVLEFICDAIQKAGYKVSEQIGLALDCASSSFYEEGHYNIGKEKLSREGLIQYYKKLVQGFPILSIEDPLEENDWQGWSQMTQDMGSKIQIVGDDLFVTQVRRLQEGIEKKAANAVLIKVNQVGTLTETLDTMRLADKVHYRSVVSHRSGETEDTTISHLAVGTGSGQIKTGASCRGERTAKYNELLRLEDWYNAQGYKTSLGKIRH